MVQYALCSPSRTSFLTSLRPDTTRVWTIGPNFRNTTARGGQAARKKVDMGLAHRRLAERGGEYLGQRRELVDGAVHAVEVDGEVLGPDPLVGSVRAVLSAGDGEEGRCGASRIFVTTSCMASAAES